MVLALAGDSTMTRLVLPLVTGPLLLAAEAELLERAEEAEDVEEARERVPLAPVALLLVDFPVVFLVVVAI